ncbi:MAG: hypothetical protein V1645_02005 [archaeon]
MVVSLADSISGLEKVMRKNFTTKTGEARALLAFIGSQDKTVMTKLYIHLVQNYALLDNDGEEVSGESMPNSKWKSLSKKYIPICESFAESARKQNDDIEIFAAKLRERVESVKDDDERAFFLINILHNPSLIPYRKIPDDTSRMSDEEFDSRMKRLRPQISELNILMVPGRFDTWTMEAASILRLINNSPDEMDRAVLMAHVLMRGNGGMPAGMPAMIIATIGGAPRSVPEGGLFGSFTSKLKS